jgi:hypothetical protein
MKPPEGSPDWLEAFTAAERPDLWERALQEGDLDRVWPEYNHHGTDSPATFRALVPRYGDFQLLFTDRRAGQVVARGARSRSAGTARSPACRAASTPSDPAR